MASTPSNRLRLTPCNSPYFPAPIRTPRRGRPQVEAEARLTLKRVVGTTCSDPSGFDATGSTFAYTAGGAVVVVDIDGDTYKQKFYRARPTAVPVFPSPTPSNAPLTPNSTPKANDRRNRVSLSLRDSLFGSSDPTASPTAQTWTSRERIKAATCISLSRDGKYLAVGETGYLPRVLVFNLQDESSDIPLVSISEHGHGVRAVAWSSDGQYLASLGTPNDGTLYIWKADTRTGALELFQQNKCTSHVVGITWLGDSLLTYGTRHVKVWRIEKPTASPSPTKKAFLGDVSSPSTPQRTLPGRNILLGSLLNATFTCVLRVDPTRAIVCSDIGDICVLDDTGRQMKLDKLANAGFPICSIASRDQRAYIVGQEGQYAVANIQHLLNGDCDLSQFTRTAPHGFTALAFLEDSLVTIDGKKCVNTWAVESLADGPHAGRPTLTIPGHRESVSGIGRLFALNKHKANFYTWSSTGRVQYWDLEGNVRMSVELPFEKGIIDEEGSISNEVCTVQTSRDGSLLFYGDKVGMLRVLETSSMRVMLESKAHSYDCHNIAIFEDDTQMIIATCGRDRTVQLFARSHEGNLELFQTLEFMARVVVALFAPDKSLVTCSVDRTLQVHNLVSKVDDNSVMAAIQSRTVGLKTSPVCMTFGAEGASVFVSTMDRSIAQVELQTGQSLRTFKCVDEGGADTVLMDSLMFGPSVDGNPAYLIGSSNTDKSIRLYNGETGAFMAREWGHTECIGGVIVVKDASGEPRAVSAASDGTIMTWGLAVSEHTLGSRSRDPSPVKDSPMSIHQPTLRRILSKSELAEFQRPDDSPRGRSPPRVLNRRKSNHGFSWSTTRTPTAPSVSSSTLSLVEETPSRRVSGESRANSPPAVSPRDRIARRPSLPVLNATPPSQPQPRKRPSITNMRSSYGFGGLSLATEQTSRQLKTYRKKLSSSEPIQADKVAEIEAELRLTIAALGERVNRTKQERNESVLTGLLDEYSQKLVSMLDEKLRLRLDGKENTPPIDEVGEHTPKAIKGGDERDESPSRGQESPGWTTSGSSA